MSRHREVIEYHECDMCFSDLDETNFGHAKVSDWDYLFKIFPDLKFYKEQGIEWCDDCIEHIINEAIKNMKAEGIESPDDSRLGD